MNIRQNYYGKLGYKGVEEKGKLEFLLDDKKAKDLNKLKMFAQDFAIHSHHRLTLWCYLTNLYPISPTNHKYVIAQRLEQFSDLRRAVLILRLVDESAPVEQIYFMMWLLEKQRLPFGNRLSVQEDHPFLAVSKALRQCFPDRDYQIYFLAKSLCSLSSDSDIDSLVAQTFAELESYDPKLLRELEQRKVLHQLPVSRWFQKCFAGVVNSASLVRIWDKLLGGVPLVLLGYLYIQMLRHQRDRLLVCDSESCERTFDVFANHQEAADRVVNHAIEMLEVNKKSSGS